MVSGCPCHLGNPLGSSPKVGFSCTVKIQKGFLSYSIFFFLEGDCSVFCKIAVESYSRDVLMISGDFLKW